MKTSKFSIITLVILCISLLTACSKPQAVSCGTGDITSGAWALKSYGLPGSLQSPLEGTLITFQVLSNRTKIAGSAGCNAYFGDCQVDSETCGLKIEAISTTEKACNPPIAQQETKFLALLKAAQKYTVSAGELRITAGKEVLVFVPYVEQQ